MMPAPLHPASLSPLLSRRAVARTLCATVAALLAANALAQGAAPELTAAEVRKVDAAAGKITLRHGPIKNLDMPPMTMVFQVQNPQWLQGLNVGDKVLFSADKLNGAYTVTRLQAGGNGP